jgi:hypothetical protein
MAASLPSGGCELMFRAIVTPFERRSSCVTFPSWPNSTDLKYSTHNQRSVPQLQLRERGRHIRWLLPAHESLGRIVRGLKFRSHKRRIGLATDKKPNEISKSNNALDHF